MVDGKEYDYYAMTQKLRSMERNIRALKREKEALEKLGMSSTDVSAKIKRKTREYKEFCDKVGVPKSTSNLRVENGSSDLKSTKTYQKFNDILLKNNSKLDNRDVIIKTDTTYNKGTISMIQNIEQRNVGRGNANAISHFGIGLNNRQSILFEKLKEYDSRCIVKKKSVSMADLSALTAETGVEFAMFTKGQERLIIRGNEISVNVTVATAKRLKLAGYRWSGHTHPGTDDFCLMPSSGDKEILQIFNQECTAIYNSTGKWYVLEKEEQ